MTDYMDTASLKLQYKPEPHVRDGVQTFDTPNDMYLYCTHDLLANSDTISRKGRLYKSRKPYAFQVDSTEYAYITLPGSCYHDRPAWMLWELLDFFLGEEVLGGYSVAWDHHRRTVYPKGNGASDWSYKKALGLANEQQLWYARRSLLLDSASRNCVISPWHAERDLKRYVMNKEADQQRGDTYQRLPCITTLQFSQREHTKMLDCFQYQRSLDFTGAVHTDLWRFAEITDWLARTSYPGGYGGASSVFVGTIAIESYGAAAFVKFNKALEWWCNDESVQSLPYFWPSHKDGYLYEEPNKPRQKQYEFYIAQFWKLIEAARHFYYCRFEQGIEALEQCQYLYYRDWGYALMICSALLALEQREQRAGQLYDCDKVKAAYDWLDKHPVPELLSKCTNYYQYYAGVEAVRLGILQCNPELIEGVTDVLIDAADAYASSKDQPALTGSELDAISRSVFVDALVHTNKRQRKALVQADDCYERDVAFFEEVFG